LQAFVGGTTDPVLGTLQGEGPRRCSMYKRILVGTDGSESADKAVDHALKLAKLTGGKVHVVTAWQSIPAMALSGQMGPAVPIAVDDGAWVTELHDRSVAQGKRMGVPVQGHSVQGPAAQVIVELAQELEADLVVVGDAGMHGLRGHLASVPNSVAHKCPCAVLVVPTTD
jgi:nucleotide-binding universal stress UspA family protein